MSAPQVLLVTGASSGIGRAVARQAAARGDHLVLVARGADSLKETAAECEQAGAASTLVLPADVGDDRQVADLVRQVVDAHGRIDAVVSNAGVVAYGRVDEVPAEVFDRVIRTNLLGSVNVARHVLPVLRGQRHGSLLLVGSVIGHIGVPGMTAYAVSKWAVRALARHLQLENRDLPDVHVGYVAPGGVDTPIYQQAANYTGFVGRPPPPVASPERIARQILDRLGGRRRPEQLTLVNDVVMFGFNALPFVYDRIIHPFFAVGATNLSAPVDPHTGNVLEPREDGNAVRGGHGSALVGIARNLRTKLLPPGPGEPSPKS